MFTTCRIVVRSSSVLVPLTEKNVAALKTWLTHQQSSFQTAVKGLVLTIIIFVIFCLETSIYAVIDKMFPSLNFYKGEPKI